MLGLFIWMQVPSQTAEQARERYEPEKFQTQDTFSGAGETSGSGYFVATGSRGV
jgi:hypothetical protein